jgi:hypothetical protein
MEARASGAVPLRQRLTLLHRCVRTLLCITAKLIVEWQLRVKLRRPRREHKPARVPQIADIILKRAEGVKERSRTLFCGLWRP